MKNILNKEKNGIRKELLLVKSKMEVNDQNLK